MAALSLYWFILILFKNRYLALLTSLFFVVHPVHTEAVAYISGRADPLSLLFMLISFILYIKYLDYKKISFYIFSLICFIIAILSRESTLVLPVLLVIYNFFFKKKAKFKYTIPYFAVAAGYLVFRITYFKILLPHLETPNSFIKRIPGFFIALFHYIRLLIFPTDLHMEYGAKLYKFTNIYSLLGLAIFIALIFSAFRFRNKKKLISFGIVWFIITLLPSSNIYYIKSFMAEHWLYLPSVGFFLILSFIFIHALKLKKTRLITAIFLIALFSFYFATTVKQNRYWQSRLELYKHTLKYAPKSARVYNNMGNAYKKIEKYDKAVQCYKKALEIKPDYLSAYNNLAIAYSVTEQYDKAISLYKKTIKKWPYYAPTYYNLGVCYSNMGKFEKAIAFYKKSIELYPDHAESYCNMAKAYYNLEKYDKAIEALKKAIAINSAYPEAYFNLGLTYVAEKEYKKAITSYKNALKLKNDYPQVYNNIAVAYYHLGKYKEADKNIKKAQELGIEVHPGFLKALKQHL
jgi:tetratricopeptide (TPR) repeat protein